VDSEEVVEWRALTVALMDELLTEIRFRNQDMKQLTMSKMLQNATWVMGRELAFKRDPSGNPPLKIVADNKSGTLF